MNNRINNSAIHWSREPWPWLLASGPFLVVIASFVSAWFAVKSSDGLVSEDYYREGLAVQETLSRSEKATSLGLIAHLRITSDSLNVALTTKAKGFALPAALRVTVSHPTRAGLDQTVLIPLVGTGYSSKFRLPAAGHWLSMVEDDQKAWRVLGSVVLPVSGEITLGELAPAE